MPISLNFDDLNWLENPFSGSAASTISAEMFGEIALSALHNPNHIGGADYDAHFQEVTTYLSSNLIRFPDGEMPDGFVYDDGGTLKFHHNNINGGDSSTFFDPITGAAQNTSGFTFNQAYLDSLVPAFSLGYDELIHDSLITDGELSFSESLQQAIESGATYTLVLPEFQYLKIPINRDPDGDGVKDAFVANDHVKFDALKADIINFLTKLFVTGGFNSGNLPSNFVLEIGNEDYFGWNSNLATKDSSHDYDSYSAYAYAVLSAVKDFRDANPNVDFQVSLQASGPNWIDELEANFADMNGSSLFTEVDVISLPHILTLDATLDNVVNIEEDWTLHQSIEAMQALISGDPQNPANAELYMAAWSATSKDVYTQTSVGNNDDESFRLPAAGTTLAVFSGMFEMGFNMAANWGIGSTDWYKTKATDVIDGVTHYAPYIEAYRLMAESLIGTHQIVSPLMDGLRSGDYNVYAYEDDAKAVVFLAANAFTGDVVVDLSNLGDIGYLWIERISEAGNDTDGYTTIVTREFVSYDIDSFTITFNQPYEVIRVIAALENPGEGYLYLWGTDGIDTLVGGLSGDLLEGNDGKDTLHGNAGNDQLFGGALADTLYGNAGDDVLDGGYGGDILDGGAGFDVASYDGFGGTVTVTLLNQGVAQNTGPAGTDTLISIEGLSGAQFNDHLTGSTGANTLAGLGGNDTLVGLGGDDVMDGGVGNDNVLGGTGNDTLYGSGGRDTLLGGTGIDELHGGDENDQLRGGDGSDTLTGGAGRDVLIGGDFSGGGFPGDGAADTFVFLAVSDSVAGGATRDIIRDFEVGLDQIDLAGIDAITGGGDDAFSYIGSAAFTGTAGELRAFNVGVNTVLRGDVDGDGLADFEVFLNGTLTLTGVDFIL